MTSIFSKLTSISRHHELIAFYENIKVFRRSQIKPASRADHYNYIYLLIFWKEVKYL